MTKQNNEDETLLNQCQSYPELKNPNQKSGSAAIKLDVSQTKWSQYEITHIQMCNEITQFKSLPMNIETII